MITHYIYHIPGKKCGCTKDLDVRRSWYRTNVRDKIELLEELHDKTDQQAGDIEDRWNEKFGYPLGVHYAVSPGVILSPERRKEIINRNVTMEQRSEWGRIGAKKFLESVTSEQLSEWGRKGGRNRIDSLSPDQRKELHKLMTHNVTSEQRSEWGRKGAERRNEVLSKEQRSEIGRKGAKGRLDRLSKEQLSEGSRKMLAGMTPEQRSERSRKIGLVTANVRDICPHCGLKSTRVVLHRWHFDNCPKKRPIKRLM